MSAFSSLATFYDLDRERRSPEITFGMFWDWQGRTFRVAWLATTGELIAVAHDEAPPGRRMQAASHAANVDLADRDWQVYVLAVGTRDEIDDALDGWPEEVGAPDSMGWVKARVGHLDDLLRRARPYLPSREPA